MVEKVPVSVPKARNTMGHQFKDCCYTCWFNRKNRGRAGHPRRERDEPAFCVLRDLPIRDAAETFCANHPLRYPGKLPLPVGPVYRLDGWGVRRVWRPSPDSEAIRKQLLELLDEMPREPRAEYPFGVPFDEVVVWQLGQFKETRAVEGLRRVLGFDPALSDEVFGLNRFMTVRTAHEVLQQIEAVTLPDDRKPQRLLGE